MEKLKDMDMEMLLEKYMDGDTSNKEEELLRRYFTTVGNDIPDEWCIYKALFKFETEEKEEKVNAVADVKPTIVPEERPRRRMWIATGLLSAAASVAVLIMILLAIPGSEKNYAMIDGKKYTNHKMVVKEAEEALLLVSIDEDEAFDALEQMQ